MKKIDGDNFLMNVFLELIRRNRLEINLIDLRKMEWNFLSSLEKDNVILENSVDNILDFVKKYEECLYIMEQDGEEKILISKEEDFKDKLLEEYEQDIDNNAAYRKALKMEINEAKKIA